MTRRSEQLNYQPNGPRGIPPAWHPKLGGEWSPEPRQADGSRYPSMGLAAAAWIQTNTTLTLDVWQVEWLRRLFLYDPDTLDWIVRDAIMVGPEGIGKSAFNGAIALWMLEGPMLPPVDSPRRHPSPNIPVVGAASSLTDHIRKYAKGFVEGDADSTGGPLGGRVVCENTKLFRAGKEDHCVFFPAGSGALQQGANPRPAIIEEELHVAGMPGVRADGVETIEVFSSKRSKTSRPVKCQRITVTNPDDGDPESLLGRRWLRARAVLDGDIVDPSMLVVHYHAITPVDLDDPADLRRGIAEATPASWADREAIAAKYEVDRQTEGRFSRFSLGLFHAADDVVLPEGTIEEAARPGRDVPGPDVRSVRAFDGARNRDSIALYGCTIPDDPDGDLFSWKIDVWERPGDAGPDWRYDREAILQTIRDELDADPDAKLAMDDQWWEDYADQLEREYPGRIVRGYQSEGPAAWETFRRAALDGRWTHDGSVELLRHTRNAVEVESRSGIVKLAKRRTNVHIDGLVTTTYAVRLAIGLSLDRGDDYTYDELAEALGLDELEEHTA